MSRTHSKVHPAVVAARDGNPALRMMGLPRMRAKLPSRNWMIFWTITGSFTAAIVYDRMQVKKIQDRWCRRVSHLASQPLNTQEMPRRITVYLEAPPGDYLLSAREYFRDYVKPILVSAAIDWDLVEGRREGDVRHKLASRIRQQRKASGERPPEFEGQMFEEDGIDSIRTKSGVHESSERGGDLVIGRHTWKEYVRGLHEGWLGPLEFPVSSLAHDDPIATKGNVDHSSADLLALKDVGSLERSVNTSMDDRKEDSASEADSMSPIDNGEGQRAGNQPAGGNLNPEPHMITQPVGEETVPYIQPSEYIGSRLASSAPSHFDPSLPLGFPHLLGFFNTPTRIWRFLNKRDVAEMTSAAVVAFVLSSDQNIRPFRDENGSSTVTKEADSFSEPISPVKASEGLAVGEWQTILEHEELDWHKSARAPNSESEKSKERPWQESMVIDKRLGERMRIVDVESFVERTPSGSIANAEELPTAADLSETHDSRASFHSVDWKGGANQNMHMSLMQRLWKWYKGASPDGSGRLER